jgi:hypothetical protein
MKNRINGVEKLLYKTIYRYTFDGTNRQRSWNGCVVLVDTH